MHYSRRSTIVTGIEHLTLSLNQDSLSQARPDYPAYVDEELQLNGLRAIHVGQCDVLIMYG